MLSVTRKQALITLGLNLILVSVITIQLYQIYDVVMLSKLEKDSPIFEKLEVLSFCINVTLITLLLQLITWFFKKYSVMFVSGGISILVYFIKMAIFYF